MYNLAVFICLLFLFSTKVAFAQQGRISGTEFNPAISLILDGRYTDADSSELELPGFQLGGEAELPENGFSTGHNELALSANVDDKFYGSTNLAIVQEEGETVVELEEAWLETLKLGNGFSIKAGQFFSNIGYLKNIHDHAHDFADRPLIYDALFGGHLVDTGIQARWLAPTDFYLSFGTEITTGSSFPGGENEDNSNGSAFFVKTGGDIGTSSSWQLGLSNYSSDFDVREAGGHHGDEDEAAADNELLNGEVDITGVDFVYKWAPNGNSKEKSFKLQAEYFVREESGRSEFTEGTEFAEADYDGEQSGYYLQALYKFSPAWRIGARLEKLTADNNVIIDPASTLDADEFLEESALGAEGDPKRTSFMLDYSASHFSVFRLQFNQLESGHEGSNDSIQLQYIMSLGSHPAHAF